MSKSTLVLFPVLGFLAISGCGGSSTQIVNDTVTTGEPPAVTTPTNDTSDELSDETPALDEPLHEELPSGETEEIPAESAILRLDAEIALKGVSPNGSIVLTSTQALDATSVTRGIELRDAETTETVPADVLYDGDTNTVTVTPSTLLTEGEYYSLHNDGVLDVNGQAISTDAGVVVKVKQRLYSRLTTYDDQGNIRTTVTYDRVPGANAARWVSYVGTDEIKRYENVVFLPGDIEIRKRYNGPGPNGLWFDDDDELQGAIRTRRHHDGRMREIIGSDDSGPDGKYFTTDDDFGSAQFWIYSSNGQLAAYIHMPSDEAHPGVDGVWMTQDDPISSYFSYRYDDDERLEAELFVADKGEDGTWFTDDDGFNYARHFEYTSNGKIQVESVVQSPGLNGKWFDADDEVYVAFHHRQNGDSVIEETLSGGHWLEHYEYRLEDDKGRPLAKGRFGTRGPDASWYTEDDQLDSLGGWAYRYTHNANGMPEQHAFAVNDNGPDGIRFSGDEIVNILVVRGYDDTSRLSYMRRYESDGSTVDDWSNANAHLDLEYEYYDAEIDE